MKGRPRKDRQYLITRRHELVVSLVTVEHYTQEDVAVIMNLDPSNVSRIVSLWTGCRKPCAECGEDTIDLVGDGTVYVCANGCEVRTK